LKSIPAEVISYNLLVSQRERVALGTVRRQRLNPVPGGQLLIEDFGGSTAFAPCRLCGRLGIAAEIGIVVS
jgi:hypothetical protein